MSLMRRKSLVVVEDDPVERNRLVNLIQGEPGYKCAGSFGSAEEFLNFHRSLQIDGVILDLELGKLSGLDCLKRLMKEGYDYPVMVLTQHQEPAQFSEAIEYGAHCYQTKPISSSSFFESLHSLLNGEIRIGSSVAYILKKKLLHNEKTFSGQYALSKRELEILTLISQGLKDREVAEKLGITHKTVENHVANLIRKMQAANRAHAVALGFKNGLISGECG